MNEKKCCVMCQKYSVDFPDFNCLKCKTGTGNKNHKDLFVAKKEKQEKNNERV